MITDATIPLLRSSHRQCSPTSASLMCYLHISERSWNTVAVHSRRRGGLLRCGTGVAVVLTPKSMKAYDLQLPRVRFMSFTDTGVK